MCTATTWHTSKGDLSVLQDRKATAVANANIALVKYWGNADQELRLPANPSLSMNLAGVTSTTTVAFDPALKADEVSLDGAPALGDRLQRVVDHLDRIRRMARWSLRARVSSSNNFPSGVGLASSASGFAALSLAATAAAKLRLPEGQLSALARLASGSACRSIPGGFVEWHPAKQHKDSFGVCVVPSDHWALVDVIAIVAAEHKDIGSTLGHALADTSPMQTARVATSKSRFDECKAALLDRDFGRLAQVVELEALVMHAVMLTSAPPLFYWAPTTLELIQAVRRWRSAGLQVAFTIDAGPNVHCLCPEAVADEVEERLWAVRGVQRIIRAQPGGPTRLIASHLF